MRPCGDKNIQPGPFGQNGANLLQVFAGCCIIAKPRQNRLRLLYASQRLADLGGVEVCVDRVPAVNWRDLLDWLPL
ncbi:MAG: hypothetical protein ABI977_35500, partial [Acidobacteriota bacterium]